MRRHVFDPDRELGFCVVCRGYEGSLPTECPGVPMDRFTSQRVYACTMDFEDGRWTTKRRRTALVIRISEQAILPEVPLDAVDPYPRRRRDCPVTGESGVEMQEATKSS